MRELKFRAWDGSKMTNEIRLEFAHGLRLVSVDDLGFDMTGDDKCVLMQYTGMKDKNGKEIYEGDIVFCKAESQFEEQTGNMEIGFAGYEWKTRKLDIYSSMNAALGLNWGGWEEFEVVGNIYENKEMVEVYEE